MQRIATELPDVFILKPDIHTDERGEFFEMFRTFFLIRFGIPRLFAAQGNESYSKHLVIRGLHWQNPPQAKLVRVLTGEILDVVVDVRWKSPTFGQSVRRQLISSRPEFLYVPRGFAHGFMVLSREGARVEYFCDREYAPQGQYGIRWDDPKLHINWITTKPILSEQDARWPFLDDVPQTALPPYKP